MKPIICWSSFRLRPISLDDAPVLASWDFLPTNIGVQRRIIVDQMLTPGALTFVAETETLTLDVLRLAVVGWGMIERTAEDGDELRWVVAPRHRRQGVGKRIAQLLAEMATRPWATIDASNIASQKVAEAAGFVQSVYTPSIWTLLR